MSLETRCISRNAEYDHQIPTLVTGWCLSTTTDAIGGSSVGDSERPQCLELSPDFPVIRVVTARPLLVDGTEAVTGLADDCRDRIVSRKCIMHGTILKNTRMQ